MYKKVARCTYPENFGFISDTVVIHKCLFTWVWFSISKVATSMVLISKILLSTGRYSESLLHWRYVISTRHISILRDIHGTLRRWYTTPTICYIGDLNFTLSWLQKRSKLENGIGKPETNIMFKTSSAKAPFRKIFQWSMFYLFFVLKYSRLVLNSNLKLKPNSE